MKLLATSRPLSYLLLALCCGCAAHQKTPIAEDGLPADPMALAAQQLQPKANTPLVQFVTLNPGHFHAYLVQKQQLAGVDTNVYVYAPQGAEIDAHLSAIAQFNSRPNNPTHWQEHTFVGETFQSRWLREKPGNTLVLAGDNSRKADYILQGVQAGYNIHTDKPIAINQAAYDKLAQAVTLAQQKGLILRDIMTERYEITTILQGLLARIPSVYGEQQLGTPSDPAVTKESVHHFCKTVAGKTLRRPAWYYDVTRQGEGIVDVTTHLVDLVQYELFPGERLTPADVKICSASKWATRISQADFQKSTGLKDFPLFLDRYRTPDRGAIDVLANGAFTYTLKGVHAKVSVIWDFEPPEGGGDTHYSCMRGSRASLIIRQGKAERYRPELYVEPAKEVDTSEAERNLQLALRGINLRYPGVSYEKSEKGFRILIPATYHNGHEAHFTQATEQFIRYLRAGQMPQWESDCLLTKYYTLVQAKALADRQPMVKPTSSTTQP